MAAAAAAGDGCWSAAAGPGGGALTAVAAAAGAGGGRGKMAELGKKYCVYCLAEVSPLRFRCTECQDIELCPECFSAGAEIGHHRRYHGYQLVDGGRFTLWGPEAEGGWTSREEQLLLDAIEQFGFGNWVSSGPGGRRTCGFGAAAEGRGDRASSRPRPGAERLSHPPKVTQQEVAERGFGPWLSDTRAVFPAFGITSVGVCRVHPLGETPDGVGVGGHRQVRRLDSSRRPRKELGLPGGQWW